VAIVLVSYASRALRGSQELLRDTTRQVGGLDDAFFHTPRHIERSFRRAHAQILGQPKGAGYWLWKPYFINRHLQQLGEDDWLFWCDAGSFLVEQPALLVEHVRPYRPSVVVFDSALYWLEFMYTKRDAFLLAGCDKPTFWASPQRQAGFSLWRGTNIARQVASEWLELACDPRAITDQSNELGMPDLPGFREHRHDQSLLSLVTKRHRIPSWRTPSQHGNRWMNHYPESGYPQIVYSTGWRLPTALQRVRARLALGTRARALMS